MSSGTSDRDPHGHGQEGTAARIRALRIRAGKSQEEMSQLLDLNPAWYADLESRDDELTFTLTLFQAMQLASALGVRLHELLSEGIPPAQLVSLMDLPGRISEHLAREGISIGQLEDRVGWELGELIDSPLQAAAQVPMIFLQAVADALGIDWLSLIPEDDS